MARRRSILGTVYNLSALMEYVLVFLALLCAIVGLVGAVVPALPGPPLSFVGLLLLAFCGSADISITTIVVTGVVAAAVTLLDFVAPIWLTNKKGGSKYSMWGAGIGMFVGLFFSLPGIIIGPFLGALIGEFLAGRSADRALEIAFMSFISFMLTTGIKFIYSLVLFIMVVFEWWSILWQ